MKDILNQIIDSSYWQCAIFDGAIMLKGRILSPSEAEQAGVMQFMVASQLLKTPEDLKQIKNIQEIQEKKQENEAQTINDILNATRNLGFRPEMLGQINEQNNKIIAQVVREASTDGGLTWQKLQIVLSVDHQDANANRLWIGTIPKEDIDTILSKAMNGYKEGREKINTFFRKQ